MPLLRRGILMLDEDDAMLDAYLSLDYPASWRVRIGPRAPLSEIYNRVFEEYPLLPWYGIFADDVTPETPEWDRRLIEAAGADGLAYPDDGIEKATHFCLGGGLVRDMGWLAYPGLQRLYIDTVWQDVARSRGVLRYLPEVRVTHRHPSAGLALHDGIYRKQGKAADAALYRKFKETL